MNPISKTLLIFNFLFAIYSCTIVLKPLEDKNGVEAGLILIQGSQVDSKNYNLFGMALQNKFAGKLWVAISQFSSNIPLGTTIGKEITAAFDNLMKAGCNLNADMPFFFAGHSLGGTFLQDYILNDNVTSSLPVKYSGLILEGSYVTRKNYAKTQKTQAPILTLGAELDGVNRITRMAESYYFNMKETKESETLEKITLIINGMNHYQFAGEGEPAPFSVIKLNDITPEIDNESARDQVTSIIISFMNISMGLSTSQDKDLIQNYLLSTSQLINPLIDALTMEGYYYFTQPCYLAPKGEPCNIGCPWSQHSQQGMGGPNVTTYGNDLFFRASQIFPDPLPEIHNKCSEPYSCSLNISTVTEAVYSSADEKDTALEPIAALELKSKLMSRQSILKAATGITFDFEKTDGGNLCAEINQKSMQWAQNITPKKTLERYLQKGRKLTFGTDVNMSSAGPLWIWTSLKYNDAVDPVTKKPVTEVRAPLMKFKVDYFIKLTAGFHYCKVLSPARAIEWMYVDSLKP